MADIKNSIEEHKKTLLQIWDKAASGDITANFEEFRSELEKDGLIMADLFNAASFDTAAGEDLQKQIEIRGHINQFTGLESQRIQRQDSLAALEEADEHLAKAFAMAKSTIIDPAMQKSFFALETAICRNVEPLIKRLQTPPKYH